MPGRPPYIVHCDSVPEKEGHYPAPFDAEKLSFGRDLGKAAGTVKLGAWQERLPPGRRTSFTHAHSREEEFVYVLSGECSIRTISPGENADEYVVRAGDAIAFPPGTGIAHCAVNRGSHDCLLLCFGERHPDTDRCVYPEDAAYNEHFRAQRPQHHWDPTAAAQPPVTLKTERLLIRLVEPEAALGVCRYYERNREHLRPFETERPDDFLTERYWSRRLVTFRREYEEGISLRLFLFLRENPSEVMGTISLTNIVRGPLQAANLGYGIDQSVQGRGLMSEALGAVVQFAFNHMKLHRLSANYQPTNERSAQLLRKAGFLVEGHARNYLRIHGKWCDHVLTALTNPSPDAN